MTSNRDRCRLSSLFFYLLLALGAGRAAAADPSPRASFDLTTEQGFPITGAQEWTKVLSDLGISNVRIHSGAATEVKIDESQQTRGQRSYKVFGILRANGSLDLPGGNFRSADRAGLKQWLTKLGAGGKEGVTVEAGPFGLLPSQLEKINDDLEQTVAASTTGATAEKVVQAVGKQLRFPLRVDPSAETPLKRSRMIDELKGLSAGTALAAVCRSAGCILVPTPDNRGAMRYEVTHSRRGDSGWAVGRDVGSKGVRVLPGLFDNADVEISETPLLDVLTSISQQLDAPLVIDRYALADQRIDLDKLVANHPAKKTTYGLALRRVLGKALLRYELRVDEQGRPFLWVSTVQTVE